MLERETLSALLSAENKTTLASIHSFQSGRTCKREDLEQILTLELKKWEAMYVSKWTWKMESKEGDFADPKPKEEHEGDTWSLPWVFVSLECAV